MKLSLQAAMERAGIISNGELSRAVGVTPGMISKWSKGESRPSEANLAKLAAVLNVAVDELDLEVGKVGRPEGFRFPREAREYLSAAQRARWQQRKQRERQHELAMT